jgi:hypothetical protein
MYSHSAGMKIANGAPAWILSFAREPEREFEKDDGPDEPVVLGSTEPSAKPPHLRPWILVLLLLIVAGGTYLASDPSLVLDLIGQGPPSAPPVSPPTVAQPPSEVAPSPPPAPEPPPSAPLIPPPAPPPNVPTPLFSEGQRVTLKPDSSSPTGSISLTGNAEGTRPGPTIRAGSTLTVLDAELQNNVWIYSVRAETGVRGWVAENRLAIR